MLDLDLTVDEMKNYLRINNDEDELLLLDLIESAKEEIGVYINRDYKTLEGIQLPIPTRLKTVAMQIVAIRYENRTTIRHGNMSSSVAEMIKEELQSLSSYRRTPGL